MRAVVSGGVCSLLSVSVHCSSDCGLLGLCVTQYIVQLLVQLLVIHCLSNSYRCSDRPVSMCSKTSADVEECYGTSGLGSAQKGMSHYSLASSGAPLFRPGLHLVGSGLTVNDTWHCQPSTAGNHSPGVFQLCPVVVE